MIEKNGTLHTEIIVLAEEHSKIRRKYEDSN